MELCIIFFRDTLLKKDFSFDAVISEFCNLQTKNEGACLILSAPVAEENVSKVSCLTFIYVSLKRKVYVTFEILSCNRFSKYSNKDSNNLLHFTSMG